MSDHNEIVRYNELRLTGPYKSIGSRVVLVSDASNLSYVGPIVCRVECIREVDTLLGTYSMMYLVR